MNEAVRFRLSKSQREITQEWDLIAPRRDEQLRNDADISFSKVLKPFFVSSLREAQSIVDVGCGTGNLSSSLRAQGRRVLGLDPSTKSVETARSYDPSGEYIVGTLEAWAAANPREKFDVAVVNMVLMDVLDLRGFCQALSHVARGGRVLATIAHPSFWPLYWNYASNQGFDYMSETIVEAPFRTTSKSYPLTTTHIHRPLSTYFTEIIASGMRLTGFEELRGAEPTKQFPFPRFIAFEASA